MIGLASVDLERLMTSLFSFLSRNIKKHSGGKQEANIVLIYQWLNSSQSIGLPSKVELDKVWLAITHSSNQTSPMKLEKCETSLKGDALSQ